MRHTLDEAHEGIPNIPENKKPQSGTNSIESQENGKHHQIPGNRGRRRIGTGRTDRNIVWRNPGAPPGAFLGTLKRTLPNASPETT